MSYYSGKYSDFCSYSEREARKVNDALLNIENIKYFHNYCLNSGFLGYNSLDYTKYKKGLVNKSEPRSLLRIDTSITMDIKCQLCGNFFSFDIELEKPIELGHCEYYTNPVIKIQRYWRLRKKIPTLWKIAEYYTSKKYSPNNILKYVNLNE